MVRFSYSHLVLPTFLALFTSSLNYHLYDSLDFILMELFTIRTEAKVYRINKGYGVRFIDDYVVIMREITKLLYVVFDH